MKISVLVPTYNAGSTLHATLQSIVDQGDPDFEIIIADGGSTDATLSIASRFAPHVATIIPGPDRGQLDAIFRAAAASTGDVLYWLNADDVALPGAFHAARSALAGGADFVFSDDFAFDEDTQRLFVGATIKGLTRRQHELFYRQLYSETVFFRRKLLPEPDPAFFDLRVYTDYYFFLRTLSGARGVWVPKRLGAFRVLPGQASQKWAARKEAEFTRIRAWYYQQQGWSRSRLLSLRVLHAPAFLLSQWLRPNIERGVRRMLRLLTGDARRADQASLFFSSWLRVGPGQADSEHEQEPTKRLLLETSLYR